MINCRYITKKYVNWTGFDMVLPMNTGAEAVETAIKAVRKWGYTKKVLRQIALKSCLFGKFPRKNNYYISFSTDEDSRNCFGPFTTGFNVAEYVNLDSVKDLVNKNTVAIMQEPIQGEAGIKNPICRLPERFEKNL